MEVTWNENSKGNRQSSTKLIQTSKMLFILMCLSREASTKTTTISVKWTNLS